MAVQSSEWAQLIIGCLADRNQCKDNYIIATVLAVLMGQVVSHFINRLPEIIEEKNEFKKLIPTLKTGFKLDIKYTAILLVIFNTMVSFITTNIVWAYMIVVAMLIVALVIDFKLQLIPDTVQVVIVLVGIILTIVDYANYLNHIIGMVLAAGIFILIAIFSKIVFRKEGMGIGDIKLMAGLGLVLGIEAMPSSMLDLFAKSHVIFTITIIAFFMAAIVAIILIVTGKTEKSQYMAFGPYIVVATILVMIFGTKPFLDVYFNLCTWLANGMTEIILKLM